MIRVAVRSKDMGRAERSFTDPQSATVELIKAEQVSGYRTLNQIATQRSSNLRQRLALLEVAFSSHGYRLS
ncbi:MAG TPA: hypothetical protein VNR51_01295, partial [Hyphomicrobium sp.]|nr:hypothetical protein [Hyphomicrobium sp.]